MGFIPQLNKKSKASSHFQKFYDTFNQLQFYPLEHEQQQRASETLPGANFSNEKIPSSDVGGDAIDTSFADNSSRHFRMAAILSCPVTNTRKSFYMIVSEQDFRNVSTIIIHQNEVCFKVFQAPGPCSSHAAVWFGAPSTRRPTYVGPHLPTDEMEWVRGKEQLSHRKETQ